MRHSQALALAPTQPSTAPERCHIGYPAQHDPELATCPHVAYYRKSSEGDERQALSVDQQRSAVLKAVPGGQVLHEFWEAKSGTTFDDRRAFLAVEAYCRANPRDRATPGTVWAWDHDRFSRQQLKIGGVTKSDTLLMVERKLSLAKFGWGWNFANSPTSGMDELDIVSSTIKSSAAGEKSRQLSTDVRRGKADIADKIGAWTAGTVPYPALRVERKTGRILQHGDRAIPDHGITLVANPDWVPHWDRAARLFLEGWNVQRIADVFNAEKVPKSPRMHDWRGRNVMRMLTNPALIGKPRFRVGQADERVYDAVWGPIVDPDVFRQVQTEVRRRKGRTPGPRSFGAKPLNLTCPACDIVFHQRSLPNGRRVYSHPSPHAGMGRYEWRQAATAAGCTTIMVDAVDAEQVVFDLICRERLSDDYLTLVKKEFDRQHARNDSADDQEAVAKRSLATAQRSYEQASTNFLDVVNPALRTKLLAELEVRQLKVEECERSLARARTHTRDVEQDWETLQARVNEDRQFAALWESSDLHGRATLLDRWVEAVDVNTMPLPEPATKRRASRFAGVVSRKALVVFLRSRPEEHQTLVLPTRYGHGKLMADGPNSGRMACKHQLATGASRWILELPTRYGRSSTQSARPIFRRNLTMATVSSSSR